MISCSKNDSEDFFEEKDEKGFVGYWREEIKTGYKTETIYLALDAYGRGGFVGFDGQWSYNNSILTIDEEKEIHFRFAITSKTDKMWTANDNYGHGWCMERMNNQDFCSFISRNRYHYIINEDERFEKPSFFEKELERNGIGEHEIIVAKNPDEIFNPNKPITYLSPTDFRTEAGTITIKNPYDFSKWEISFTGLITGSYYYSFRK